MPRLANTSRRFPAVVALWLCALAACALLWVAPAQAKVVHVFAGSFGGPCTGAGGACEPGQFKEPTGVAVDDSTHEAYVVDRADNRVERFAFNTTTKVYEIVGEFNGSASPTGVFSEPTLVAVDNSGNPLDPSNGDVYVVDSGNGVIDKFTETGTYIGQITGAQCEVETEPPPCPKSKLLPFIKGRSGIRGIAVDPKGTLWADEFEGNVYDFSDALENGYIATRRTSLGVDIYTLGVDSEDNLYLETSFGVGKFNSAGELLVNPFAGGTVVSHEPISSIAVDPVGKEAYVDYDTTIEALTLGGSQIESFGSGHLPVGKYPSEASKGVGVDASNGTVFASDIATSNVTVFDAVTLPGVELMPLSERTPRSVTLNGTVNPNGEPVTSCVFEYDTREYREGEAAHGTSVPCSSGAGELVSAHLTGLTPETKYDYRLVAENKANIPSETPNQEFTAGPVLGGEFVTNVASESATLNVPLDPNGDDTRYVFQFGATTSYGFEAPVPAPGVDIGSTPGVQSIAVHVQSHLAPGTLYHYRLVVLQNGEEFAEPDRTFTTQRVSEGPVLPDGRGWELVSPPNNHGALIEPFGSDNATGTVTGDPIQAASDGSGIAYLALGPVGEGARGKTSWAQTLSVRAGGGGWRSQDLTLPRGAPGAEEPEVPPGLDEKDVYQVFSSDLSSALVEPPTEGPPRLSPEAPERTIYLRDDLHGGFSPLVWAGNVPNPEELSWGVESSEQLHFVTATPDLSHVLLSSPHAFTPEAVTEGKEYANLGQWNLYEWSSGRLQLVNILPDGEPTSGSKPSVRLAGGASSNGGVPDDTIPSAISSDGRRVAWDLGGADPITDQEYGSLFVRDMVDGSTVKVSGPGGVFQWMSSNGADVFFLEGGDLHVCEIVEAEKEISCDYHDLTADHAAGEANAGVQPLVSDVSGDGSYVYFVAHGVLEQGGVVPLNAEGHAPVGGEDNLYLLHDHGGVWSTAFVATLAPEDQNDWVRTNTSYGPQSPPDLSYITSRVSPDGRYLAFMSDRPLTGYDNTDAASGEPDEEVFLYHAPEDPGGGSGSLVCASCDPTGARPVGVFDPPQGSSNAESLLVDRSHLWEGSWLAGSVPGWDPDFAEGSRYQPRYLSDGGRLFFDSPDGLVPHAANGVEDVYQYEPVGVGDCRAGASTGTVVYASSAGGCVGLISSGRSSQESAFFDASENGNDVFFVTTAKLVPADVSNSYAVYDAHVCGSEGVPCPSEHATPPECSSGDSCKAAPSPQPEIFGPAPSATFSGAGNAVPEAKRAVNPKVKPLKCKQGLAKNKNNKCVKRPKAKKRAKKSAHTNRKANR